MSSELDGGNAGNQRNDAIDAKKFPSKKSPTDPSYAVLSVALDSDTYNMNHRYRGLCLIFNNKEFETHTQLNVRKGTDVDAASLYNIFRDLDFNVTIYHNASKTDVLAALKKAALEDHSNNDCFVCVILSHGDEGVIYGRDGKFRTDTIFEPFLGDVCTSLAGKPKLFFIQACQGDRLDSGILLGTGHDGYEMVKIPSRADILVAYSTVPGYYSWRNTTKGSWFIQALCYVFKKHAKEKELLEMLTMVNRRVAYDFESCTPDNSVMHEKKQISCFTSMLTRKVYFPSK